MDPTLSLRPSGPTLPIIRNDHVEPVNLDELKNRPVIELACLPFSERAVDAEYNQLIIDAQNQIIFSDGEDLEAISVALLQSWQNDRLPYSTRQYAQRFILVFLIKMGLIRVNELPCFDRSNNQEQKIIYGLRNCLYEIMERIKELGSSLQQIRHPAKGFSENEPIPSQNTEAFEQIESTIALLYERAHHIYQYLQKNDDKIDVLLLRNIRLYISLDISVDRDKFDSAVSLCQFLVNANCTHPEIEPLQKVLGIRPDSVGKACYVEKDIHDYLMKVAEEADCPNAAYWRALHTKDELEKVNYLSKAALQGDKRAIYRLNGMEPEWGELLPDIFSPEAQIGYIGWEFAVKNRAEKIVKAIQFHSVAEPVFREQNELFVISPEATFNERMKIGMRDSRSFDPDTKANGIEILQGLATLTDHPLAVQAWHLANYMLGSLSNRILMVERYIIRESCTNQLSPSENQYGRLTTHMNALVKELHVLKNKGEVERIQRCVYQLIDMMIKIASSTAVSNLAARSIVYEILLSENVIDDQATIEEVKIHSAIFAGTMSSRDQMVLDCFKRAARIPNRPNLTLHVAKLICPDIKQSSAADIGHALYYFEKAHREVVLGNSYADAYCWLKQRDELINGKLDEAATSLSQVSTFNIGGRNNKHIFAAVSAFEWAALAGNRQARFEFLEKSVEYKNELDDYCRSLSPSIKRRSDADLRRELGEMYVTGSHSPFPKQDVEWGSELLERAAENDDAWAAFLLTKHWSTKVQQANDFVTFTSHWHNPEKKAQEYFDKGVNSLYLELNAKQTLAAQLDPALINDIFMLSKYYRGQHNQYKVNQVLKTLLDKAVEIGNPLAMDMQYAMLKERMNATLKGDMEKSKKETQRSTASGSDKKSEAAVSTKPVTNDNAPIEIESNTRPNAKGFLKEKRAGDAQYAYDDL